MEVFFFVKDSFADLSDMYFAGIHQPPDKPVTDLTQFIIGAIEYTNQFHTVLAGDLNIDVMNNSNVTRNYI